MTVIIQVKDIHELDEIAQWLAHRNIVIQQVFPGKISAFELLARLRKFRVQLPADYRFNREEAHER